MLAGKNWVRTKCARCARHVPDTRARPVPLTHIVAIPLVQAGEWGRWLHRGQLGIPDSELLATLWTSECRHMRSSAKGDKGPARRRAGSRWDERVAGSVTLRPEPC